MAYFDPKKETELITDASPSGLSAILMQNTPGQEDRRVVAYASRSLTDIERRYSQTEREALAIVWAVERLHLYLHSGHFKLITDCKPVQLIFGNPRSKPPPIALNSGTCDSKATIMKLCTQKEAKTILTSCPDNPVLRRMTSKALWQKSTSISSHLLLFQKQ